MARNPFTGALTVTLEDVSASASGGPALHEVSLRIEPHVVTVVLGPSGSGRTTLARVAAGLAEPTRGVVRANGQDLARLSSGERRAFRSSVSASIGGSRPQFSRMSDSMTVFDNLVADLGAHGVPLEERRRRVGCFVRECGLDEHRDRIPGTLPGAVQRRLGLLRALALDAGLLILDDVDAGLDAHGVAAVLRALAAARRDRAATVLLVTHHLELARSVADRSVVLLDGRVAASGPTDEVLGDARTEEELFARLHRPATRTPGVTGTSWRPPGRDPGDGPPGAPARFVALFVVAAVLLVLAFFGYAYAHLP